MNVWSERMDAMKHIQVYLGGCAFTFYIRQGALPRTISSTHLPTHLSALFSFLTPPISLSRGYSWCPKLTGFYGIGFRRITVALCFELYTSIIIPILSIYSSPFLVTAIRNNCVWSPSFLHFFCLNHFQQTFSA